MLNWSSDALGQDIRSDSTAWAWLTPVLWDASCMLVVVVFGTPNCYGTVGLLLVVVLSVSFNL